MNTKQQSIKYFILILLIAVLVTPAIALASWWNPLSWNIGSWFKSTSQVQIQKQPTPQIVGNDRDSHGCIGSAGYTWCAVKNKCLRTWEEKCEATTQNIVACTMDAKLCPDGSAVGRTAPKCEFAPCPTTDSATKCLASGGKVDTTTCYCSGTKDFYNNCAIGTCTCTPNPTYAKEIKSCTCGQGKCFDGNKCVNLSY